MIGIIHCDAVRGQRANAYTYRPKNSRMGSSIFDDNSSDFRQIVWSEPILASLQLRRKFHIAEPTEAKLGQN